MKTTPIIACDGTDTHGFNVLMKRLSQRSAQYVLGLMGDYSRYVVAYTSVVYIAKKPFYSVTCV